MLDSLEHTCVCTFQEPHTYDHFCNGCGNQWPQEGKEQYRRWFAWRPVRTYDQGWTWLKHVYRRAK